MSKANNWLLGEASNVFSQCGEDGIIRRILDLIGKGDGSCVEFGAWDGVHLSNCRNLILNKNYAAVLIEANEEKFKALRKTYGENSKVHPIHAFVGFDEQSGLDSLLAKIPIPRDFDFLSIDIDGNDYHVWEAVKKHQPKVVCIEYNPTMPNEVEFIQARDPGIAQGNSLAALVKLGKSKNYELVCATELNGIFVDAKYFPLFDISDNSLRELRRDYPLVTFVFAGYDGTIFLRGHGGLPWHKMRYNSDKLQQVPRVFRQHPERFSSWKSFWFKHYRRLRAALFR